MDLLLAGLVAMGLAGAPQDAPDSLTDLRWSNRIILARGAADADAWIAALRARDAEIVDRDIVWFVFTSEATETNLPGVGPQLMRSARAVLRGEAQRVLLVGKDGGIKVQQATLNLDALFERIDRMPMRRREMERDT